MRPNNRLPAHATAKTKNYQNMLSSVTIKNFRSVRDLTLDLGRVTVLIGSNGCGKSNILEAIALGAAAAAGKLDSEALISRGIRSSSPRMMRSGFSPASAKLPVELSFRSGGDVYKAELTHDGEPYSSWKNRAVDQFFERLKTLLAGKAADQKRILEFMKTSEGYEATARQLGMHAPSLSTFIVYQPQASTLRALRTESHVEPLGIYGEGLFKLLKHIARSATKAKEVEDTLNVISWFTSFSTVDTAEERHILADDLFVHDKFGQFDELAVNEGFLFLLFQACVMVSSHTPTFFAIDNVDAGLNPKLAAHSIRRIVAQARQHRKQVILTTHNPAALDGLDLSDPRQKLFVVQRKVLGETEVRRVPNRKRVGTAPVVPLSEAFMRGYLGGLPEGF